LIGGIERRIASCGVHRHIIHRRVQQWPKIEEQRLELGLIKHRRLDQKRAGPARNQRRIGFNLPLDFVRRIWDFLVHRASPVSARLADVRRTLT
jgi:hypothetical protein